MKQFKSFKSYRNQSGFTLVEVGVVVAIVLLLLAGVVGANRIIAGIKVNDEIGELKMITTNVQRIYANNSNYATLTLADVIALKGVPESRIASATTASNRWGGAITMTPVTLTTANDGVRLDTTGVPTYECISVIPQVDPGFAVIAVGGTTVKALGGALNKTALGTACAPGNVTISYTFTK